ncbi:NADH-ubiquinone oxidoreductase-F iron-sulfur binding region domain-containing protein [Streptomyces sp. M19]
MGPVTGHVVGRCRPARSPRAGRTPPRGRPRRPPAPLPRPATAAGGLDTADRLDRVAHLTTHGSAPRLDAAELVALAENIDLRGRGGAGFPFARKLRAVVEAAGAGGRGGRTAVVVNGSEGEPSCLKDTVLLLRAPHLVLDGALLAAGALNAEEVAIGVHRADVETSVRNAIGERGPTGCRVTVTRLPERFVAGEGSALINGSPAAGRCPRAGRSGPARADSAACRRCCPTPRRTPNSPSPRGWGPALPGDRTAHRAGHGAAHRRRVVGRGDAHGVPLPYVLELCGLGLGQAVLMGGYHGTWLDAYRAWNVLVSRESLTAYGATLGAGAVLPLPEGSCPVGETARVARWLGAESAGQCGPCFLGLPALADALDRAAHGGGQEALDAVDAYLAAVRKRGACGHPDGTAGFVASALATFPGSSPSTRSARAAGGRC